MRMYRARQTTMTMAYAAATVRTEWTLARERSCPRRVRKRMPAPRFHQNHSRRSICFGLGQASAGTATKRIANAMAIRTTVSRPRRKYMSERRVVVIIQFVEHAPGGAGGERQEHDGP